MLLNVLGRCREIFKMGISTNQEVLRDFVCSPFLVENK